MRLRFFARFIFIAASLQTGLMGSVTEHLQAQPVEAVFNSSEAPIGQLVNRPRAGCDFSAPSPRALWLDLQLGRRTGCGTETWNLTLKPHQITMSQVIPAERFEPLPTRTFEYYYSVGPGCGTCGGLNGGPSYSLELGAEPWAVRYWEVHGTYVDMFAGGTVYQYSSAWSLDVGREVGDVVVYAGWTSLRHYWRPNSWTDLQGPTVGARWSAGSLSFDLALRQAQPNILGTSLKATLSIPLSDNLSTSIGLDQWVYFVRPGAYWEWTIPYVGVKTEW